MLVVEILIYFNTLGYFYISPLTKQRWYITMQKNNRLVVGNNGLNQLAQLQQQPTQAFVVSGHVTTAQSLDRNRIENATL